VPPNEPELTCDLHRPGAVFIGRCIYFEERLGQEVCNNKNGPLFCATGGKPGRTLTEQELEQMRVKQ
jgi:hypothetical protein